jgi:hypothetical protein
MNAVMVPTSGELATADSDPAVPQYQTAVLADLRRSKIAYATRHLRMTDVASLLVAGLTPRAGDILLARVERLGQHSGLQLQSGRRATLFVGDTIIVAYGARYAPDQFEAHVPPQIGACDLIAAGGIAAALVSSHRRMRAPTQLRALGILADAQGHPINLRRYALGQCGLPRNTPPLLVVAGTAMNAGKTTAASHLIHGLRAAGLCVGAAKLTGTGSCGDTALMSDAGAEHVLDFTDAGLASTYLVDADELCRASSRLLDHLAQRGAQVIVAELADGLLQRETAALLRYPAFCRRVSGVVFASQEAMGAVGGVEWLERHGLPVLALTGLMTASPLASREAADATGLPVLGLDALQDPISAAALLREAGTRVRLTSVGD